MSDLRSFLAALTLTLPVLATAQTPATPAEPAPPAAPPAEKAAPPPPPAVQLYGTFNVNVHYADVGDATTGANPAPRFVVSADSSNVGVRGTLKLSDAYSAVYQCETGANIEGEALASLCNRNSRIGLSSFWGTLALGNWDTPMKAGHYGTKADDPFGNTDVFGFQGVMGSPGFQTKTSAFNNAQPAATGFASFDNRGGNSVLYWSPKISGLSARVQWGVDEFRGPTDSRVDPMLLGANVAFETPIFAVVASAEYHEDAYGLRVVNAGANTNNTSAKDWAWRVTAGTDLPLGVGVLNVVGWVEQLMYTQDDAPGTGDLKDWSRFAWLLGAKFRVGPHEFRARYSQAMDPDTTAGNASTATYNESDLGAQQAALGYAYYLGKATQAYLFASQIMNDTRARYTFGVAGSANLTTGTPGTPAGADLTAIGIGMRHAF